MDATTAPTERRPLPEGPFDLAIVGGGINGAAVARDAVLRGLTVCLLEKGDFASGTSSRSSKMLHGGMRYLENLQFGLVFEALRERTLQLKLAPHLTSAQQFVIPVYEDSRRSARWIRLGIALYDLLALGRRLGKGRFLSSDEVLERAPGLSGLGLLGGGLYFDGVMDDARLCLANFLDAHEAARHGQLHSRNYAEVTAVTATSPIGLTVHDRVLDREMRLLANRVVRVVGPWTDEKSGERLLEPSKGVHIVLPAIEASAYGPHGLLLTHSRDGRVFFVVPWRGKTLVGTTETPFEGPPETVRVEPGEVEYLLSEFGRTFPELGFTAKDVLGTFAGIRPLARARLGWRRLGSVSRQHRIVDDGHGILTVVGGKYTNYRAVASTVVDHAAPGTPRSDTTCRPLHGGDGGDWERYRRAQASPYLDRFGEALVRHLFSRYGTKLSEVLALVDTDPALGEPLGGRSGGRGGGLDIRAEVVHSVRRESVVYPADFLCRRTDLRFSTGNGRDIYDEVERLIRATVGPTGLPPDLEAARAAFFNELEWEDALRATNVKGRAGERTHHEEHEGHEEKK